MTDRDYRPVPVEVITASQGGNTLGHERVRVPIDIEARLAEMDAEWGVPIDIETPLYRAPDVMDDRLNLLHQEVLASGDQDSIRTMEVVNFTFKYCYFNWFSHEKRVALYGNLKKWYENESVPHPSSYLITAREKKIVSDCSGRFGNGEWYFYSSSPHRDDYIPTPTLEGIYDYDFPDQEEEKHIVQIENQ